MKPPNRSKLSVDEQTLPLISRTDKMDLPKLSIQLSKLKEYRKLMVAGEHEAADDLYISHCYECLA